MNTKKPPHSLVLVKLTLFYAHIAEPCIENGIPERKHNNEIIINIHEIFKDNFHNFMYFNE